MEITLIRHGESEVELKGKARSKEVSEILRSYDQSGITGSPPEHAIQKASNCNAVVCSDFLRSLQSAEALGVTDIHLSDPIFREVATPHFKGGSFTLPVSIWGVLLRSMSVFGFSRNGESISMAKKRAELASSALIELAHSHVSILLVGHGLINYFIAKELLSRKWSGPSKPGNKYWEYGVYRYNAT